MPSPEKTMNLILLNQLVLLKCAMYPDRPGLNEAYVRDAISQTEAFIAKRREQAHAKP